MKAKISGFHGVVFISAARPVDKSDIRNVPPSELRESEPRCVCLHGLYSHYMCGDPSESVCQTKCGCAQFKPGPRDLPKDYKFIETVSEQTPQPKLRAVATAPHSTKREVNKMGFTRNSDLREQLQSLLETIESGDTESAREWIRAAIKKLGE